MMPNVTFTDGLSIGIIVVLLFVDVILAYKGGIKNTFSYRCAVWSRGFPIVPLLAGILMGHLFWPNSGYCP